MTKKKMHELVMEACNTHNASEDLVKVLSDLTKPKVGGGATSPEDYTCYDADGNVTHILCTYHKRWEPVVAEDGEGNEIVLFKQDEKSKNGYHRSCVEGASQWNEQAKIFKTSEKAIMTEVLDGVITGPEAKEQIAALQTERDTRLSREDGLGQEDKPCKA